MWTEPHSGHRCVTGFGLIEVLVTLVVVAIGLLGMLQLQSASLVAMRQAAIKNDAVTLAHNMAIRMQINPGLHYDGLVTALHPDPVASPGCIDQACQPAAMRSFLATVWANHLAHRLPRGRGRIACIASASCQSYRITVSWRSTHPVDADTPANCPDANDTQAAANRRCIHLAVRP